eukprot:8738009-Pyramimonas_sp.AAC.1
MASTGYTGTGSDCSQVICPARVRPHARGPGKRPGSLHRKYSKCCEAVAAPIGCLGGGRVGDYFA